MAGGIVRGLKAAGYAVELATNGADGARLAVLPSFALVVLDLLLPVQTGFAVLERMRAKGVKTPVIVLTALTELDDRLRVFELGAADFLAKPFFMEELVARIRTRLRQRDESPKRVIAWADVAVDLDARTVTVAKADVAFTRTELDLLIHLLERPERAVSRAQLGEATAGDEPKDARTIDSHIARVRKKLGPAGTAVQTVWGIGYKFQP